MNKRVIINPYAIELLDFKSIGTYRMYFYILSRYDDEIKRIKLKYSEINNDVNLSDATIKRAIMELKYNNIIEKVDGTKYWFKMNKSNKYGKRKGNNE